MIKNREVLKEFEDNYVRGEKLTYSRSLKIFESMWNEAVKLRVLPQKDPMEGIEADINLAKTLNLCLKKSLPE